VSFAAFKRAPHFSIYAHRLRHGVVSARILGVAIRISHQLSRRRRGWLHQLHRQHRRIRWAENFRRPESAHRIVQHWFRRDDCVLDYCVRAGADLSARKFRRDYFFSATSNGAPVLARMSSTVASEWISVRTSPPPSFTSNTHKSVMIRLTTLKPVI